MIPILKFVSAVALWVFAVAVVVSIVSALLAVLVPVIPFLAGAALSIAVFGSILFGMAKGSARKLS